MGRGVTEHKVFGFYWLKKETRVEKGNFSVFIGFYWLKKETFRSCEKVHNNNTSNVPRKLWSQWQSRNRYKRRKHGLPASQKFLCPENHSAV
jgi:tagatose-1,6-bisphosphate aldolase non-catalytic subunit AgaZ/GatZ